MMTPVCIKLHNFKKFKIEHEGQLYELAATSSENLLNEFQKYKPEVKQLLVARPIAADDFEGLAEGSVVFASTQSYITEAQMQAGEIHQDGSQPLSIDYKTPTTYSSAIVSYSGSGGMSHNSDQKLRTDLSMVDNYCSPPSGFIEAVAEPGPIDTIEVAGRVREILERYKISQTLFSKYVIRRSQGTTSDLLRTPKQWDRMSEEGRTPYRRMKAWLEGDLTHNIQMLVRIRQGQDIVPAYCHPKGLRTKFTDEQRDALEIFFSQNPRLTHDTLEAFANEHNLTISAVRNWVNNRKQRLKRNYGSSLSEESEEKHPKMEKQMCLDEISAERGVNLESDTLKADDDDKDIDSPPGIPTMVSTPTFSHQNGNSSDTKRTEQENEIASGVFETSGGRSEADLEKFFPSSSTVWEKNNPS